MLSAEKRLSTWRPDLGELLDKIGLIALMVEISTGYAWDKDPATTYALSLATAALLKKTWRRRRLPAARDATAQQDCRWIRQPKRAGGVD
jgi:hypothetical protein